MRTHQLNVVTIIGIVFGIIALGISLYAITQSTEFRQRASEGAVLILSSTKQKATTGESFDLLLDVETNAVPIESVAVNLTYPTNKLELVSIDTSHSPFDVPSEDIHGDGYIRLARDVSFIVSGKNHIATIHFTAKSTVDLNDLRPVAGTAIVDTHNKNIYTNAIMRNQINSIESSNNSLFDIQFFFRVFSSLFRKN